MKNRKRLLSMVLLALTAFGIGCRREPTPCSGAGCGPEPSFFPARIGTRWTYRITVSDTTPPLYFRRDIWPARGDMGRVYETFGRYMGALKNGGARGSFTLILRVKGPAPARQGRWQYGDSVELAVEKDELGVFENHRQVMWAIPSANLGASAGTPIYHEVVTRSAEHAPGGAGMYGNGFSDRILYFESVAREQVHEVANPTDKLLYFGEEGARRHFRRTVEPRHTEDELKQPFSEDMWYERGKGLVRLEQTVRGRSTMTWELLHFEEGK